MVTSGGHVEYVRSSSVRTAVLAAVRETARGTTDLVADLEASESAVYEAVNDLANRGLLRDEAGEWHPTGLGVVVWDSLDRETRIQNELTGEEEYWTRHDPSVIPPYYRRFELLADAEVLRASDADPHRLTRTIADRIREADRAWILATIYHPEFAEAIAGCDDARLVLDRTVVSEVADDSGDGDGPEIPIRIGEVPFSLAVTEDSTLLSLPLREGGYDAKTELCAESDAAVKWGQDLFEHYWAAATPVPD